MKTKTKGLTQVERDTLIDKIKGEHAGVLAAVFNTYKRARACGLLLLEAKAKIRSGHYTSFVELECGISDRTGQVYRQIARHPELDPQQIAGLTLNGILKTYISKKKKPSVKQILTTLTPVTVEPTATEPEPKVIASGTGDEMPWPKGPATPAPLQLPAPGESVIVDPVPDIVDVSLICNIKMERSLYELILTDGCDAKIILITKEAGDFELPCEVSDIEEEEEKE